MATNTRKLSIVVSVQDQTRKKLGGIRRKFAQFSDEMKVVGEKIGNAIGVGMAAGIASATVAVGVLGRNVKDQFSEIDHLAKTAMRLGINIEMIRGLQLAGKLGGVEFEQLNRILKDTAKRLSESAKGIGEAKDAVDELGLDAEALIRLPITQQLDAVLSGLKKIENQADRIRIADKIMGEGGVQALSLLGTNLNQARLEAELLGVTLDKAGADAIQRSNDELTRAQFAIKGIEQSIAIGIAPFTEKINRNVRDVAGIASVLLTDIKTIPLVLQEGFLRASIAGLRAVDVVGVALAQAITAPINAAIELLEKVTGEKFAEIRVIRNRLINSLTDSLKVELDLVREELNKAANLPGRLGGNGADGDADGKPTSPSIGQSRQPGITNGRLLTGAAQSGAQRIAEIAEARNKEAAKQAKDQLDETKKVEELLRTLVMNPNTQKLGTLLQ